MNRRDFLAGAILAPLAVRAAGAATPSVVVSKSPTCGCCGAWIEHMREAGFEVEAHDVSDEALQALKQRVGLSPEQSSCHTAEVEGYFIEGHVPAEDVHRLLAQRPEARGLTVPGMPMGSPGMEMGDMRDRFDTLLIGPDGSATVFARH